jgi:hypothetical protein
MGVPSSVGCIPLLLLFFAGQLPNGADIDQTKTGTQFFQIA